MEFTAWCRAAETGVIAMYIREREREGWRLSRVERGSIYGSEGRKAVAKTKTHTCRRTNASLKRLTLIYAVMMEMVEIQRGNTDGDKSV